MKFPELQKLAQRVQLKIKPKEVNYLLASLSELEKLLVEFRKLKLGNSQSYQPQAKITLKRLRQLTKKFSMCATKQEIIRYNATVSTKNFLVVHKSNSNLVE